MLYRFLFALALLGSGQGWATDIKVELLDCQLQGASTGNAAALRTRCDAVETVRTKPGGVFTLTAIITDTEGKPVAGRKAWLEVVAGDKPVDGALLQWQASKVAPQLTDSEGVVSFTGLMLAWNLPWWNLQLAVVVSSAEQERQQVAFPLGSLPAYYRHATKLIEEPQYVLIASRPPRPEWHLTYDGGIPSGTVVRWYVYADGESSKIREFTTREVSSHSLRLMGSKGENVFTEDDNTCYTLVVAIGAPVSLVTATRGGYGYGC